MTLHRPDLPDPLRAGRYRFDDALFFLVAGTMSTILGYRFGTGVQLEQFPLILKVIDPSYLPHDFFVANATQFGPRFYYANTLAWLASWTSLPAVIFSLSLLVNVALAAVTYFAARSVLRAERLAGFIASVLALSVTSFPLGLVTDIRFHTFQPGSLAIVGALASLWAGLKMRPIPAAALAGAASLMQPLYGAETGLIAVATSASAALLIPGMSPSQRRRALLAAGGGFALLGAITVLCWIVPVSRIPRIPEADLIEIVAYFRSPHHYIPSRFPLRHYVSFAAFLSATAFAWTVWRRSQPQPHDVVFVVPTLLVLAGCLGGYLFVELWPSREWTTAQPFRLLFIVKWQGFLVLGWLVAHALRAGSLATRLSGLAMLMATGAAHVPVAFLNAAALWLHTTRAHSSDRWRAVTLVLAACLSAVFIVVRGDLSELVLVGVGVTAAVLLAGNAVGRWQRGVVGAISAAIVVAVIVNHRMGWAQWDLIQPVLTWNDHRGPDAEIARWARDHTPEDAVFLTPPGLASFRLIADRAIVTDFWAIPYVEPVMRQWKRRLDDCYGATDGGGFSALAAMDQRYRAITDARLSEVAGAYGAAFAVLYAGTSTDRPALHQNAVFQIVDLRPTAGFGPRP